MVKWTCILKPQFFGQRPKSSSKALLRFKYFSWWPLLLCWILKCWKSSWDLQHLSLKVMLKSKWLSMVLDIDFMTSTILKFEFYSCYLNSLSTWWHHHKTLRKTINSMKFYHTLNKFSRVTCSISPTCIPLVVSSKICKLSLEFFCHHNFLGFVNQYFYRMFMIFFFIEH